MKTLKPGIINTWFPKSVYVADSVALDSLSILERTIKESSSLANRTGMQQVNSSHILDDQLFNRPEFSVLVEEVMFHSLQYLHALGYSDEQIASMRMTEMWSNISYENDYLFPHHHSGSMISGAFYVKTLPDSKLRFFADPDMAKRPHTYNELNYQYCQYECIPGRLLLFKSNFIHGVDRQASGEKIVISFNIG